MIFQFDKGLQVTECRESVNAAGMSHLLALTHVVFMSKEHSDTNEWS